MKYSIRQSNFSSGIHFGIHNGRVNQTYKVRFDSSCMYEDLDWERDYNKLDGWSYTTLPFKDSSGTWQPGHHKNSLRLGWRANSKTNKIELCLYIYQDGIRTITDFTSIDVDKDYTIGVFYKVDSTDGVESNPRIVLTCTHKPDTDDSATFVATQTIALTKSFELKTSYKLFPYFGGSNPAPHNMFILSEET